MHDHVPVAVLHPRHDLLEKVPSLVFAQPPFLDNVIEQLARLDVLHHDVDVVRGLQHLVQTDDVRMHEQTQNFEDATSNLSQEVKAVPLPKNISALPEMPDLDELISDKQDTKDQLTGLPELPDMSDI